VIETIRRVVRRVGFDVTRYEPKTAGDRLARLIPGYGVQALLDVGANRGQFGSRFRAAGYVGPIFSFEPLSDAYEELCAVARDDGNWHTYNFALGAVEQAAEINVSQNSYSSSLLPMLDAHSAAAPGSVYVDTAPIRVRRLDAVWDDLSLPASGVLLKIDTQGFEAQVLEGAGRKLQVVDTIRLEMSLVPLYADQSLFSDLHSFLSGRGFKLIDVEPGFSDPETGALLQLDGTYQKSSFNA
jgi:FkbM family methyltransferase